jgi:hypothetical protein
METGTTQRFSLYTQANNNVFLESSTTDAILGLRTGNALAGGSGLRMLLRGENNNNGGSGRMALGNDLPETFVPTERLHLHHTNSTSPVRIRFTNDNIGNTATDGTYMGIQDNGLFRITQNESQPLVFQTPSNIDPSLTPRTRMQILANGQVFIGDPSDPLENVIDGNPFAGFGGQRTALLNVRGPINSCYPLSATDPLATVLYGYTSPDLIPPSTSQVGFRMKIHRDFFGGQRDAFIIEKSDGINPTPAGGIVFANVGNSSVSQTSMIIHGTGQAYVGDNNTHAPINRFTIDAQANDATPSGLRLMDLTSAATPVPNPGAGVLSVDDKGNVIYVLSNIDIITELKKNWKSYHLKLKT